jgi:hypothetical protein
VACRILPHRFVHDAQRAIGVVCYANHVRPSCQEQLDFEFAHIFHGAMGQNTAWRIAFKIGPTKAWSDGVTKQLTLP